MGVVDIQTGKVLYSVEPKTRILEDAISSIPDIGFNRCLVLDRVLVQKNREDLLQTCGDNSRNILITQVYTARKLISQENTEAAKILLNNVKKEILLLVSDFSRQNEIDPTRKEIVELIGKFINEL